MGFPGSASGLGVARLKQGRGRECSGPSSSGKHRSAGRKPGAIRAFSVSASPRANCLSSMCWSATGCSRRPSSPAPSSSGIGSPRIGRSATASLSSSRTRCSPFCRRCSAICIVAGQRLDPNMWVGRTAKPNSALDINTRFILNTFEQFILYFIGNAGARAVLPARGSAHAHHPDHLVRARAHFVLGRLSREPVFPRLRLRRHLLPDGRRLCLAHPVRWYSASGPALTPRRMEARSSPLLPVQDQSPAATRTSGC